MFWRTWSRWPFSMATEEGGNLARSSAVRPGKVKRFFLRAWARVLRTGEKSEAWAKATRSAGRAEWAMAEKAESVGGSSMSRVQRRLEALERVPWMMSLSSSLMWTESALKMAVQPASQSWPMEMSEVSPRAGKMWAMRAAGGRSGRWRSTMCVECMVLESGKETTRGSVTGRLLVKRALVDKK